MTLERTRYTDEQLPQMRRQIGRSYQLVTTVTQPRGGRPTKIAQIVCLFCGWASAHPKDIREKYCRRCCRAHEP